MTPLGKILLLMSLLAGAVVTLHENWEKVGPYVTGVMDDWKSRFWGMVDAIKNGGPLLLEAFKQGFSDAFDWLAQKLEWLWTRVPGHELLSGLWERTKTGLSWLNKELGVGSAQGREYEGNPEAEGYDSSGRRRASAYGRRRVMERGALGYERGGRRGERGYSENIPVPPGGRRGAGGEAERAFPRQEQRPEAETPRGNGRGSARAASRSEMMAYAEDQLRREGVPEKNLRAAAANLVGQAEMESSLNPNLVHDQGTGYGIYGARLGRRTAMLRWLAEHGYARNSAEGQMRYMAHDAMSGRYPRTRSALMAGGFGPATTNTITAEFEAPKIVNARHGAVVGAYNAPRIATPKKESDGSGVRRDNARNAIMHRGDRGALNSSALPTFARMGALAQRANTTNNSHAVTNNSNSNSAHINAVNINVPHADPNTIATGLDAAIRRQMYSGMANYGAR
jgi:hypothetical protein